MVCAITRILCVAAVAAAAPSALAAPPAAAPLSLTLHYEGRLHVKVLEARSDHVVERTGFRAGARVKSAGALGFIKPYSILAQSTGAVAAGRPLARRFTQAEGRKRRAVAFPQKDGSADPLTQILGLMLTPATGNPCRGRLAFFDGKQRYDLTFAPAGGGRLLRSQQGLKLGPAVRCRLTFRPIRGLGGSQRKSPVLTGEAFATFARAPAADVWVLTDVAIGTVVGQAHVSLTGLSTRGSRAAALAAR